MVNTFTPHYINSTSLTPVYLKVSYIAVEFASLEVARFLAPAQLAEMCKPRAFVIMINIFMLIVELAT